MGAGLFHISSYLAHSCAPNARISFTDSNEATLTTLSPIKKGEEITVAYAPIDGMETEERRKVLASGWRFKCECSKCGSLDAVDE